MQGDALRRGYPAAGSIRQCEKRTIALLAGIQAGGIWLNGLPKLIQLSGFSIQRANPCEEFEPLTVAGAAQVRSVRHAGRPLLLLPVELCAA